MKNQKSPNPPLTDLLHRQDTNGYSFRDLHQNFHTPIYDYASNGSDKENVDVSMPKAYFIRPADRFSDFKQREESIEGSSDNEHPHKK